MDVQDQGTGPSGKRGEVQLPSLAATGLTRWARPAPAFPSFPTVGGSLNDRTVWRCQFVSINFDAKLTSPGCG
jgi:hypothetical protein